MDRRAGKSASGMRDQLDLAWKIFPGKNAFREISPDFHPAQDRKRDQEIPQKRTEQDPGKKKKRIGMDRIGGGARQK